MNTLNPDQRDYVHRQLDDSEPSTASPDTGKMLASTNASNEAFAEHLLALLATVLSPEDLSDQLHSRNPAQSQVDDLLSQHHSRSAAELQVKKAVLDLGTRLRRAEYQLQVQGNRRLVEVDGGHLEAGKFSLPEPLLYRIPCLDSPGSWLVSPQLHLSAVPSQMLAIQRAAGTIATFGGYIST